MIMNQTIIIMQNHVLNYDYINWVGEGLGTMRSVRSPMDGCVRSVQVEHIYSVAWDSKKIT